MVNVKELSIGNMLIFLGIYLLSMFSLIYIKIVSKSFNAPKYINEVADKINAMGSHGQVEVVIVALIVLSVAIIISGMFQTFGAY